MSSHQQGQQTPDLASILQTLAQHSGQPLVPHSQTRAGLPIHHVLPQAQIPIQQHREPSSKPPIDPSKITTYPPALRYTTALLSRNPELTQRIKKLIKSQHEHEMQWWQGRSCVPAEWRKRAEGRKAVNDVLRALGGVVAEEAKGAGSAAGSDVSGGEDSEEMALREYDRKVHAACRLMVRDVRKQLKEMGIPGFVVRGELVGEGEGKVTREQVKELEGKMLQLLEDLCKD